MVDESQQHLVARLVGYLARLRRPALLITVACFAYYLATLWEYYEWPRVIYLTILLLLPVLPQFGNQARNPVWVPLFSFGLLALFYYDMSQEYLTDSYLRSGLLAFSDIAANFEITSAITAYLEWFWTWWRVAAGFAVFAAALPLLGRLASWLDRARDKYQQHQLTEAETRRQIEQRRSEERAQERVRLRALHPMSAATRPGKMTGFEPQLLAPLAHELPRSMFGLLPRSVEGNQLLRALTMTKELAENATFWDMKLPDDEFALVNPTCVIVSGREVTVVHARSWVQGDVTWRLVDGELACFDNATGHEVGEPKQMTEDIAHTHEFFVRRLAQLGVTIPVSTVIVLLPSDAGMGTVEPIKWSDAFPILGLPDFVTKLSAQGPFDHRKPGAEYVIRTLRQLTSHPSGIAPQSNEYLRETQATLPRNPYETGSFDPYAT